MYVLEIKFMVELLQDLLMHIWTCNFGCLVLEVVSTPDVTVVPPSIIVQVIGFVDWLDRGLIYICEKSLEMCICLRPEFDCHEVTTVRAPLSGTFLQTLPDLVTPLKGHSLSLCSCPPTWSAPSKRFRY